MRIRPSLFFILIIMGLSAWGVVTARAWPWKAALFPVVIGVPVFCLAAAELLWDLFGSSTEARGQTMDFQLSQHLPSEVVVRRTAAISAWILGFLLAILLLGFPIAVPLFVFLYLKIQGQEGWALSSILTATAWGFFYGLFDRLLHLPFPDGWIQTWIGVP